MGLENCIHFSSTARGCDVEKAMTEDVTCTICYLELCSPPGAPHTLTAVKQDRYLTETQVHSTVGKPQTHLGESPDLPENLALLFFMFQMPSQTLCTDW